MDDDLEFVQDGQWLTEEQDHTSSFFFFFFSPAFLFFSFFRFLVCLLLDLFLATVGHVKLIFRLASRWCLVNKVGLWMWVWKILLFVFPLPFPFIFLDLIEMGE